LSEQKHPAEPYSHVIDSGQPLSRSLLWTIQRRYFEDQGIEAFRTNIVPSYITSNPYIARRYAQVVLGYLRDIQPRLDPSQPVYLVELGAGGGRFAFHFLRCFEELLAASPFPELRFCYVLTDLPEQNLSFWLEHPSLQAWAAAGKLDFARFDALSDREIRLQIAGQSITPGELKNPLVVLCNYFFDSLPNDAFHIEQGRIKECLIQLTSKQAEPDPTAGDVLLRTKIHFKTQEDDLRGYYHDPDLDQILEQYRGLENSYLLFCADAIRLLRELIRLAGGRMLLLSGDFGGTSVEEWDHNGAPDIRIHGSISMEVNFHALGTFVKNQGGRFLAPSYLSKYLTVCAFVLGETPSGSSELALAYQEAIEQGGPNDYFMLKRGIERSYPVMPLEELVAYLRFSGWDVHLFLDCFPHLLEKTVSGAERDQKELLDGLERLWQNYYHLGEERDLPFNIGVVFFRLGQAREALAFFERSLEYYGPSPMTLYNLALCLTQQHKYTQAWARVKQALAIDHAFEPALELAKKLEKNRPKLTI
jgi:tetratricopeptide (TPR) repeat protein